MRPPHPEKKTPVCVPQDARVHYPIHKKPAHQPSNQRNRADHHERGPPPPKQQERQRYRLTADASGLNSVPRLPLTPTRPGSTPPTQELMAVLRSTRHAGRSFIDDSTSETPPTWPHER